MSEKSLVGDLKGKGISVVKDSYRDGFDEVFPPCIGKGCQKIFCKCRSKKEKNR